MTKLRSGGSRISRRGGRGPRRGGRGLPRWLRFANFVCQNKRIWTLRRARPPLDPPMLRSYCEFKLAFTVNWTDTAENIGLQFLASGLLFREKWYFS